MSTVADVLSRARAEGIDRLDAQRLLGHVLSQPRSWLIAHPEATLTSSQVRSIFDLFARSTDGEPVAYLVGEHEFHGLPLRITRDVLVPRADTETLVEWAFEQLRPDTEVDVLDMGTGSGAIALALKHRRPLARVTALDVSAAALEVAAGNASRLGLHLRLLLSDWWRAVEGERFNLIVSNPPYIAGDDEHLKALQHEPSLALTPGGNGLSALTSISQGAGAHLKPGGWLLLEHGHDQAAAVTAMLEAEGFTSVTTRRDLAGIDRCTGGQFL